MKLGVFTRRVMISARSNGIADSGPHRTRARNGGQGMMEPRAIRDMGEKQLRAHIEPKTLSLCIVERISLCTYGSVEWQDSV